MTIAVYVVCTLVAGFIMLNLVGLAMSRSWRVERTMKSAADPTDVYPLIASFEQGWSRWSPWGPASDPTMKVTYEGPASGIGATQAWTGGDSGRGRITIVEANERGRIGYQLAFGAFSIAGEIELRDGNIVWTNTGTLGGPPMFRIGGVFAERVVGKAMERGLADLIRVASSARPAALAS